MIINDLMLVGQLGRPNLVLNEKKNSFKTKYGFV